MKTELGKDILHAAELLRKGEIVAIPTETVYGLAGNALDDEAVIRIYEAKQRPRFNPLIIHLPSIEAAGNYVKEIPDVIHALADRFSPGPLSYLLPKTSIVSDLVTAGSDKVVIRIPAHPQTLELLRQLNFPLAAPSANPFGYVSPVTADHVLQGLGGKIPYILDGGACSVGLESTIIGMDGDDIIIHRLGGVSAEDIRSVTGKDPKFSLLHKKPDTPGQLESHYAPAKPLYVGDVNRLIHANPGKKKIAVISFVNTYDVYLSRPLSVTGNLHEAASNLFTALRELDRSDAEIIFAERFPDEGIGMAINDRLSRAGVSSAPF
ncbi:MAG TPA: L-threonylcarbamoyladenylate synthase [Chitinophagaceae bacterium]|nr:L-threonylcarbamoyladenylate synthase [Chitinophagaceae bacterium]